MESLVTQFRETLRQFEREISIQNDNCCNTGISLSQCHLMLDIERAKQTSVTELAQIQNLDKSTVSRTVDNLVNKGYINRQINPESRRQSMVSLNEKGQATCCSINKINNSFFDKVFKNISEDEIRSFNKVFKKITETMADIRNANETCC